MALTTIPQLEELTNADENTLILVDSGIQSHKMTAPNLGKGLLYLGRPNPTAAKTANYSIVASDAFGLLKLDSSAGGFDLQLPDPSSFAKRSLTIKDEAGFLSSNPVNLVRHDDELISGVQSDFALESDFGVWNLYCDGTNWELL